MKDFLKTISPLVSLTKKGERFDQNSKQEDAFKRLKSAFTSALVLAVFNQKKEVLLETNALDYVSIGVLLQNGDNSILRPVAFFSKKHSITEYHYEIYDKELLTIIRYFKEQRPKLEGTK